MTVGADVHRPVLSVACSGPPRPESEMEKLLLALTFFLLLASTAAGTCLDDTDETAEPVQPA